MNRLFLVLIISRLVSLLGDAIFIFGFPLYVYEKTNSSEALGISIILEISVYMIFSLIGGVIADRASPKKTIIILDILSVACTLLAYLLLSRSFSIQVCYGLIIFLSMISALYQVTFDKIPIACLHGAQLSKALSYFQTLREVVSVIGAPVGAFVLIRTGVETIFLINSISFLAPIVLLTLVSIPENPPQAKLTAVVFFQESIQGFSTLWKIPVLRYTTILAVFLNIVLSLNMVFWILLYKVYFSMNSESIGLLQSVLSIGFILISLWAGQKIREDESKSISSMIFAQILGCLACFIIFSSQENIFLSWLGSMAFVIANAMHGLPSTVLRKKNTTTQNYGKVLAAARVLSRMLAPLSMAVGVWAHRSLSIHTLYLLGGSICFFASIFPAILLYREGHENEITIPSTIKS